MTLPITMLAAGAMLLLYVHLAFRVIATRRRLQVAFGDGGEKELIRVARGHANAGEYMPLSLIAIGLNEAAGAPVWALAPLALCFVAGRAAHGLYFAHPGLLKFRWRVVGMHLTLWPLLLSALMLFWFGLAALI